MALAPQKGGAEIDEVRLHEREPPSALPKFPEEKARARACYHARDNSFTGIPRKDISKTIVHRSFVSA